MKFTALLNFIFIISLLNCSGMKETDNSEPVIQILEINSWLNLMPGGPGSFHLSGELAVTLDADDMIFDIELSEITVYSGQEILYKFKPVLQYSRTEPDLSVNSGKIEVYRFFTESGLGIKETLMADNMIDVELIISVNDYVLNKNVRSIEVTRAY